MLYQLTPVERVERRREAVRRREALAAAQPQTGEEWVKAEKELTAYLRAHPTGVVFKVQPPVRRSRNGAIRPRHSRRTRRASVRSCARSGDSGSDDEPAPPPPSRDRARLRAEVCAGRVCKFCEVAGRLIVVANREDALHVLCTVCWCDNTIVRWSR